MSFQSRLKEARLNKKYTQEQLATMIGVAKSTYTGYEKGNREPSMLTISKIMDALNIDANFLWQDELLDTGGIPFKLQYEEIEHIKKYRYIVEHSAEGKEVVDSMIDREYKRCEQDNISGQQTIFDMFSPEELENMVHAVFTQNIKDDSPSNDSNNDFPENIAKLFTIFNENKILNAAHERTDIDLPKDTDTSDNDIMDDENF